MRDNPIVTPGQRVGRPSTADETATAGAPIGTEKQFEKDLESHPSSGDAPAYNEERRGSRVETRDPFGDEDGAEVKYRTMAWWHAALIMIAETISLGILSLPSVLAAIGIVPGVILIAGLGILATYTGYTIHQFKMAYPHVHNMADVGEILFAPWGMPNVGRELLGAAQTIFLIFSMGSHILTGTIAFNTMTGHATCTIVWGVMLLVIFWLFTLPRTLKNVSYLSIASFISIFSAVMITMIGLGVSPTGTEVDATVETSLASAFLSVSNIIFAYAGHVAFFSFISELKNPHDFPKALYTLQFVDTIMYIVVAIVVYRYAGPDVASPALGSTGHILKKVSYGIALPTIIIAGVIYGHVASKYIYVRLFRGTRHMGSKTLLGFGSWAGITLVLWTIAWVIAESIPNFNDLLALISSIFASWFTYGLSGIFWLFLNYGDGGKGWVRNGRKMALAALNWTIVAIAVAIMGIGLYASGTAIAADGSSGSWSCADNSA
ncbi:amino acid transporter [Saccharata proteae CBS 121410]|uniref:Amino acid transporter n=1 Tax=Saccharata proteae CBS 121410 TaxID=1314787 RepID=A0A9P4LRZ9_9PEZI|nr:amino acid transporter [Saccharata proteae CBS 121410]